MRKAWLLQDTDPLWITDEIITDRAERRRPGRWKRIAIPIDVVAVQTNAYWEQAGGVKLSVAVFVTKISEFVGTRCAGEAIGHEDRRARAVIEVLQVLQHLRRRQRGARRRALIIHIGVGVAVRWHRGKKTERVDVIGRDQQAEIVWVGKSEHRR